MNYNDIFDLSEFKIPKELNEAAEVTFSCCANIDQKILEQREKTDAVASVVEKFRSEASVAIAEGKGDAAIKADIRKVISIKTEAIKRADHLTALLPHAYKAANAAAETIFRHKWQCIKDATIQRKSQLESAMIERDKSLKKAGNGKARSTSPEKSASACLAFCEHCDQPIARFDPKSIRQPVISEDFKTCDPLESFPKFILGMDMLHLKCPICSHQPWTEEDKILVTDGFFLVPEPYDDQQKAS